MVLFTAKDLFVSMYVWVCIQSSFQAAISNIANNICVDNCSNHGDCRVEKSVTFCECHLGWGGSTCEVPCDRYLKYIMQSNKHINICLMQLPFSHLYYDSLSRFRLPLFLYFILSFILLTTPPVYPRTSLLNSLLVPNSFTQ